MIAVRYRYMEDRFEWVAVIYDLDEPENLLTLGCEMTFNALENWIDLALTNEP